MGMNVENAFSVFKTFSIWARMTHAAKSRFLVKYDHVNLDMNKGSNFNLTLALAAVLSWHAFIYLNGRANCAETSGLRCLLVVGPSVATCLAAIKQFHWLGLHQHRLEKADATIEALSIKINYWLLLQLICQVTFGHWWSSVRGSVGSWQTSGTIPTSSSISEIILFT